MTAPGTTATLFEPDGGRWLPTELSRGPWAPDALHGGAVAALVARAAETVEGTGAGPAPTGPAGDPPGAHGPDADMVVVRLTLELLRPVPRQPLDVRAEVVRPGRKVQLVDVTVQADGRDVAWARALRLRRRADPPPAGPTTLRPTAPPGPGAAPPDPPMTGDGPAFHNGGVELRVVAGSIRQLGPCTVWTRLLVPVVPGEAPSPLQRAAAGADFGNGVSAVVPFEQWRFINPDLTVVLERPPDGEWVALEAATVLGVPGVGVARSVLWDERGPVGTATQTLVVEPRN